MSDEPKVAELRLVVTASDYEDALRFYRDVLGLPERAAHSSPGGRVTILEAGRATLELADPPHADDTRPATFGSLSRSATLQRRPPGWPPPEQKSSPGQQQRRGNPSALGCRARPVSSSPCSPSCPLRKRTRRPAGPRRYFASVLRALAAAGSLRPCPSGA
jgi:hypothetical protein